MAGMFHILQVSLCLLPYPIMHDFFVLVYRLMFGPHHLLINFPHLLQGKTQQSHPGFQQYLLSRGPALTPAASIYPNGSEAEGDGEGCTVEKDVGGDGQSRYPPGVE